jgi:soluble lytic murein transglycosylase
MKPDKAVRLISEGNLDFIFRARPSRLKELLSLHDGAAFYAGLLAESRAAAFRAESAGEPVPDRAAVNAAASARIAEALYQVSLESPSPLVREAAAERLIPLLLKAGDEDGARRLVREVRSGNRSSGSRASESLASWEKVFTLTAALPAESPRQDGSERHAAIRDLAAFFLTAGPDDAYSWAWTAVDRGFFTGAEAAAVTGCLAASRSSFAEALASFRQTLEQDEALFFRYPALLSGLGRAFQFAAGDEGSALFQEWEKRLSDGPLGDAADETRYLLPYFAGRMERQAERYEAAAELFTRALAAAPDAVQEDACMWYILDVTQSAGPESLIPLLKTYMPRWHSASYFEDILERQARYFTANRQWNALFEVYSLFPKAPGWAVRGQYAYILGRAVSLGLFGGPAPGGPALGGTAPGEEAPAPSAGLAASFFRAAREETAASFYYRALAGRFLDAAPLSFPEGRDNGLGEKEKPAEFPQPGRPGPAGQSPAEFLSGFFRYGAAGHIAPYLQDLREDLTEREIRTLIEAFSAAERWSDAIRLTAFLMSREGYELTRRDLELSFPRPFRDFVETYAAEADIPAPLFYGLIRTESAFDPEIHSRSGAAGLTQLMTATALDMAGRLNRRGGPQYAENGGVNLKDPKTNIHLGAVYLRYLMNNLKSPMSAILAYNGGFGRVRRWRAEENLLPEDLFAETIEISETREYGRRVLGAAAVYAYLYYGISMEDIVADIIK